MAEKDLRAAYKLTEKQKRTNAISEVRTKVKEAFAEDEAVEDREISDLLKKLEKDIVRGDIIITKKLIDGRKLDQVRPIIA